MKKLLILIISSICCFTLNAQNNMIQDISSAIQNGDLNPIQNHCENNVTVEILNNNNTLNKTQAIQQLNSWFKNNKPSDYSILHKGNKDNAYYVIGTLTTTNNTSFRIFYLIKNNKIQQLRIKQQ